MADQENTVFKIISNGPIEVNGNFKIIDTDGKERKLGNRVFLCQCGKSANKPFCDGSHKRG